MALTDKIDDLTDDVDEVIMERALHDAGYREELLKLGVERILAGNFDIGEALINDHIEAMTKLNEQSCNLQKSSKNHNAHSNPKCNQ